MINCVFEDGDKANLRHAVADAVVIKDGKILMVKRSAKLIADPGKWALPGGFMSRDESVIECVEREVYEETGWKVKGTTLFSITDRPEDPGSDRQNICFTYFCEATEKTGKPDWETEELQWYSSDELPSKEDMAADHTDKINLYLKSKSKGLKLPVFVS